jgi:AcrR family transcriptional regulator
MVHGEFEFNWLELQPIILKLEEEGYVTRTFRRLDPPRQGAIIEAIFYEAGEAGPASMNIKAVAGRAGVAVGSLYVYFNNRDGMLNFAVELCVRYICETLKSYIPFLVEMPVMEGLRGYLVGGIQWSQSQAAFLKLFARAAYQGDPRLAGRMVIPISKVLQEMVRAILAKAWERGEVRGDLNLEATSRAIYAWMIPLGDSQLLPYLNNYFQVSNEQISFEQVMEAALQMIARSILTEEVG